nr:hypothetical protein [Tanacetum cinerariifolium]
MPMDLLDPYAQLVIKAPPSPDYIPGPEAPPLPDYIPGLEYPDYRPSADDVLLDEDQPLPATVSPTVESPGYITDLEPEMDPEEEDGDDEKSEGDFIDYPTSRGDDDGDELLEDDADDEDEEESSDSKEEKEEHLALIEGETAATPLPSAYRLAARISVRPHIPMPFCSESEVERLLAIPTPSLSLVSPTSYLLPPFLMPLPIFTLLPPPPPIILPRTRASMVLMRYAVPSTFILAPRSRTPSIGTPLLLPIPLPTSSFPLPLLLLLVARVFLRQTCCFRRELASLLLVVDMRWARVLLLLLLGLHVWALKFNSTEGVIGLTRWFERTESVSSISNCTAENQVKFASCTLIGSALTWWNSHMRAVSQEVTYAMLWKALSYTLRFKELALLCWRMFLEESDEIERYVGGLPEMIRGNVMSYEPKSMQKAIEFANDQMDKKLLGIADL